MFFLSSFAFLQRAEGSAAIRSRRHAVHLSEVVNEVRVGSDSHLFRHLFHCEKGRAQHLLSFAQPEFLQVLSRTLAGFLFEQVSEARW